MAQPQPPKWHDDNGVTIACTEKIKVMNQNMQELHQIAQDALEDALLMGCNEQQVRQYLLNLVQNLENPYQQ